MTTGQTTARPTGAPTRAPNDVLSDHLACRAMNDIEGDVSANYDAAVVSLTPAGLLHGHDGVLRAAERLAADLPDATFRYERTLCDGDVCFLKWTAEAPSGRVTAGADAFVIRDGRIIVQTAYYVIEASTSR